MYETRRQPIVSRAVFLRRLSGHLAAALALIAGSLALGMAGYMHLEGLTSLDAFLETAMLLGGMGPLNLPQTAAGKFFAGCFALYAGLVFIATAALLFAPLAHRLLHRFHLDRD